MVYTKKMVGISLLLVAFIIAFVASGVVSAVPAQQDQTCPKTTPWTKVDDNSAADENKDTSKDKITWTAPEGYVIDEVCIKSGQAQFNYTENTTGACYKVYGIGTSTATAKRIGAESPECQNISHAAFKVKQGKDGTFFQFAKKWTGDSVNLNNVDVTFKIGDVSWKLGDLPVAVDPGQVLEPITEVVTGLPANCTYTSDLPNSYTVPGGQQSRMNSLTIDNGGEAKTYTLTAANTVDCDEDTPQVLGSQVTVTPTGGVDAGAGSSTANTAVIGLSASLLAVGVGLGLRKFSL